MKLRIMIFSNAMIRRWLCFLASASLLAFGFTHSYPQNIAQFRGINRDGHYNETKLLNQWPESGPELIWVTEGIGLGYAAPSILKDKLFVNGEIDSTSYLFAFDLKGKLLWKPATLCTSCSGRWDIVYPAWQCINGL